MKRITILMSFILVCLCLTSCCKGAWSSWKPTHSSCDSNFWCLFKGQKATYQHYEKLKECENTTLRRTKKTKLKCGC